ncbi:MAG: hypothetical protein J6R37_01195 [Clostridia bacterium]|nr:hypothetical protein [Clostridia bacterium]
MGKAKNFEKKTKGKSVGKTFCAQRLNPSKTSREKVAGNKTSNKQNTKTTMVQTPLKIDFTIQLDYVLRERKTPTKVERVSASKKNRLLFLLCMMKLVKV